MGRKGMYHKIKKKNIRTILSRRESSRASLKNSSRPFRTITRRTCAETTPAGAEAEKSTKNVTWNPMKRSGPT
jgi:hypothetical protein